MNKITKAGGGGDLTTTSAAQTKVLTQSLKPYKSVMRSEGWSKYVDVMEYVYDNRRPPYQRHRGFGMPGGIADQAALYRTLPPIKILGGMVEEIRGSLSGKVSEFEAACIATAVLGAKPNLRIDQKPEYAATLFFYLSFEADIGKFSGPLLAAALWRTVLKNKFTPELAEIAEEIESTRDVFKLGLERLEFLFGHHVDLMCDLYEGGHISFSELDPETQEWDRAIYWDDYKEGLVTLEDLDPEVREWIIQQEKPK